MAVLPTDWNGTGTISATRAISGTRARSSSGPTFFPVSMYSHTSRLSRPMDEIVPPVPIRATRRLGESVMSVSSALAPPPRTARVNGPSSGMFSPRPFHRRAGSGSQGQAGHISTGEEPMSDKAVLLQDADEAFGELHRAIDGLTEEEAGRVWLGTWGVREILIHISGWHDAMADALDNVAKGRPGYAEGMYDDYDAWNARFVADRAGVKLGRRGGGARHVSSAHGRCRARRARCAVR